jgi:hypothetical protein
MTSIDVRLGSLDDVDEAVSVYERSNLPRRPTRAHSAGLVLPATGFSPPACQATYKTIRHIRSAPRTCGQPAPMLGLGSPRSPNCPASG